MKYHYQIVNRMNQEDVKLDTRIIDGDKTIPFYEEEKALRHAKLYLLLGNLSEDDYQIRIIPVIENEFEYTVLHGNDDF